jgi:hypothetical protein
MPVLRYNDHIIEKVTLGPAALSECQVRRNATSMTNTQIWSLCSSPMRMKRIAAREDVADLILDAADRLLASRGYRGLTMEELAEQSTRRLPNRDLDPGDEYLAAQPPVDLGPVGGLA